MGRAKSKHKSCKKAEAVGSSRGGEYCPSASQAATRQFSLPFLVDPTAVVLDKETGELLKHRHLINKPKNRELWG